MVAARGGALVRSVRCAPGESEQPLGGHLIVLHQSGPRHVRWRLDGRTLEGVAASGAIGIVPAGRRLVVAFEQPLNGLSVALEERFVARVAELSGAEPDRLEVLDSFCARDGERDDQIAHLVASFLPEIGGEGLGSELYADALATQLAVHLLRRHSSLGRRRTQELARVPAGPVPKRVISQAQDYINDNLADKLSLEELARAAGYSPHHFVRIFKEATGLPPHRYVVEQRVERAMRLLAGTELPIAEIARMCGFSGQSHMGKNVKALTGATPARLRHEARR